MAEAANTDGKDLVFEGLKALWDKLDKNTDGKLTGKEWGINVSKYLDEFKTFFPGETVKEIGTYFNKTDINDDDLITWSEFVAAADVGSLHQLYLSLDKNGDGKVSAQEYGDMLTAKFAELREVFGGWTKADVGKKFSLMNTNKSKQQSDGDQFLSWEEFHQGWFNCQVPAEFIDLRKLWDAMDKNEDNKVSSKEWGAAVPKNAELMSKLFGGTTLKEIGTYFNIVDGDENNELTWKEIVVAYNNATDMSQLKKLFLEMDKDGSGFVDSKEWGRQLTEFKDRLGNFFMGKELSELGKMFNTIDTNTDNQLSWEEISTAVFLQTEEKEKAAELQNINEIDAVNDAKINFLEQNLKLRKN